VKSLRVSIMTNIFYMFCEFFIIGNITGLLRFCSSVRPSVQYRLLDRKLKTTEKIKTLM